MQGRLGFSCVISFHEFHRQSWQGVSYLLTERVDKEILG